jgi:DnaK suppressor protein
MTPDVLTPDQRARLKAELESRRERLRVEVKAQLAGSGDDRVVGLRNRIQESGDEWGVADGLAELDLAEVRHTLAELTEVDAALGRMRDGTYGECVDCGIAIAPARLVVYPALHRVPGKVRTESERPAADGRLAVRRAAYRERRAGPPGA